MDVELVHYKACACTELDPLCELYICIYSATDTSTMEWFL
jgi:hypothetical protein